MHQEKGFCQSRFHLQCPMCRPVCDTSFVHDTSSFILSSRHQDKDTGTNDHDVYRPNIGLVGMCCFVLRSFCIFSLWFQISVITDQYRGLSEKFMHVRRDVRTLLCIHWPSWYIGRSVIPCFCNTIPWLWWIWCATKVKIFKQSFRCYIERYNITQFRILFLYLLSRSLNQVNTRQITWSWRKPCWGGHWRYICRWYINCVWLCTTVTRTERLGMAAAHANSTTDGYMFRVW